MSSSAMPEIPLVVGREEGTTLGGRFEVCIKVRGEHTDGVMAVIEEALPARSLIPPHTHANDVWVYVLQGEVGVLVDERVGTASAGGWALKPRDVMHAMWNPTDEVARIIEVLTPAGSERWFEELASLPPDDPNAFDDVCRRHGITFFPDSPWIAELKSTFQL